MGQVRAALLAAALALPEAWPDSPWDPDDVVVKVRRRIFAFLGDEDADSITVKLVASLPLGRGVPGAVPAGYGLGRHGWTVVPITGDDAPSLPILLDWLEESYAAVAPKRLAALLDASHEGGPGG